MYEFVSVIIPVVRCGLNIGSKFCTMATGAFELLLLTLLLTLLLSLSLSLIITTEGFNFFKRWLLLSIFSVFEITTGLKVEPLFVSKLQNSDASTNLKGFSCLNARSYFGSAMRTPE